MDLALLQQLKEKLLHDVKLEPVWDYFMDHFAHRPEFIALGERTDHPFVEAVVAEVGKQLYAANGAINALLLTRIAKQHFVHGGFVMGGRVGGVIFFEDANIGLVTVTENPPSIEVKYARFSGRPLRKPCDPSPN